MRLHSDTLDVSAIFAALPPGVGLHAAPTVHRSAKRHHAFGVVLTGHGVTGGAGGALHPAASATWDEYGAFLGALYLLDPLMIAGPYFDAEDFALVTQGRFPDGNLPVDLHHHHRWRLIGRTVTGRNLRECKGTKAQACSARQSFYVPAHGFSAGVAS